jgi:hypothetical protein
MVPIVSIGTPKQLLNKERETNIHDLRDLFY